MGRALFKGRKGFPAVHFTYGERPYVRAWGWVRGFGKIRRHMKSARSRKKSPYGVRGREFGPCLSSAARHYITLITLLSSPFPHLISIQQFAQTFAPNFVTLHNPQKCTKKRANPLSFLFIIF